MAGKKKVEVEQEEVLMEASEAPEEELDAEEDGGIDEELIGPNGEELLFPNGPSMDKVEEWKSLHGEVYLTEFEEEVFIWRALLRKEYKDVAKVPQADNFYKEERICEKVILWPEQYNFMAMTKGKAGIPTLIAELVMEKSGFQAKTGALRL